MRQLKEISRNIGLTKTKKKIQEIEKGELESKRSLEPNKQQELLMCCVA